MKAIYAIGSIIIIMLIINNVFEVAGGVRSRPAMSELVEVLNNAMDAPEVKVIRDVEVSNKGTDLLATARIESEVDFDAVNDDLYNRVKVSGWNHIGTHDGLSGRRSREYCRNGVILVLELMEEGEVNLISISTSWSAGAQRRLPPICRRG